MIIIKATNGERLKLTATRLTQIDHGETKYPFHTTKSDLQLALDGEFRLKVHGNDCHGDRFSTPVVFSLKDKQLGCENFTARTFNLILKTMGLKK